MKETRDAQARLPAAPTMRSDRLKRLVDEAVTTIGRTPRIWAIVARLAVAAYAAGREDEQAEAKEDTYWEETS